MKNTIKLNMSKRPSYNLLDSLLQEVRAKKIAYYSKSAAQTQWLPLSYLARVIILLSVVTLECEKSTPPPSSLYF